MPQHHIAQVNIARMKAPLDDPLMARFAARISEINALADSSPGFIWRLQTTEGDATYLRPYDDDRILFNLSVWETVEALKHYVYRTAHVELLRQRHDWFEKPAKGAAAPSFQSSKDAAALRFAARVSEEFGGSSVALWWVPVGHVPGVDEAKKRLAHLDQNGPTQFAFTFQTVVQPDEEFQRGIDWSSFKPCPAV